MRYVREVDSAGFQQQVVQRSYELPVVVDFWAAWCGPCRVLGPLLEQQAEEQGGAFELVKVDVDANPELAARHEVQGIPTVIGFRDGSPVARFTGALPEQALRSWIEDFLPSEADRLVDQARSAIIDGDEEGAEALFRRALEHDPRHQDAGTSLASLLIARRQPAEALELLERLSPTPEVHRLQAAARLSERTGGEDLAALQARVAEDPEDEGARLDLASALAARGEYEPALDHLLAAVRLRGERRQEAHRAILDIFEVLGNEHPLTRAYRRQLASELF